MALPEPDPEARLASETLLGLIADEIMQEGGWMPFDRYMALALYAPQLGYYSGGSIKLGRDGDFTTSPEITPLFGQALAQPVADLLAQAEPEIIEFGAGSGKLAHDLLTELNRLDVRVERYLIVELSGELRARQRVALKDFPQVEWVDRLPAAFSGVAIGNEVLDAMPVRLVKKADAGWCEIGVGNAAGRLCFVEREADADLQSQIAAQIPQDDALPQGYMTEVHAQAVGFMRTLAAIIADGGAGAAILIDYGFPSREFYLDQRTQGTLMCHYRHHAHTDPFWLPGLQDITAHVDFSAMADAAEAGGLDVLAYMNQASFLMAAGIGDLLQRTSPEDAAAYLPQANAVQKLLSPAEMGELFKVLIVGTGVELPESLVRADRSSRL